MQKTAQHVPPGSYFHTPRKTTNTSFAIITPPTSMAHNKASNSRCSCRSRRYFSMKHIEGTPTDYLLPLAHYSSMPYPAMLTNLFYLNSTNGFQKLHLPRPESPRLMNKGTLCRPPEALAPAKVEEVPEDIRQNWHTALDSFLKEYQCQPKPPCGSSLLLATSANDTKCQRCDQ